MIDQKPPQEIDAEESILASCILVREDREKVFNSLSPEDFYLKANRIIFEKCMELQGNGEHIETAAIYAALSEDDKKFVKAEFLGRLTGTVPVAVNIDDCIKRVKDAAKYRRAIELCNAIAKNAHRSDSEALERLTLQLAVEIKEPEVDPAEQKDSDLSFPYQVIQGAGGYYANVISEYSEAPQQFTFMAYLTLLGCAVSPSLKIKTFLDTQPRLYTVLVGESALARKSTIINKTVKHFRSNIINFNVRYGIGSPEGLQKIVDSTDTVTLKPSGILLVFDEFKSFVDKATIKNSVLLPCINTLFEINIYENVTKSNHINIQNAYISMLAATTKLTYETIYDDKFTRIGFPNRVFLVPGSGERKFSIPPEIPEYEEAKLNENLIKILKHVGDDMALELTPEARSIYDDWYMNRMEQSVHALRLDTYSLRLMMLLAINNLKSEIDAETVKHAIDLCNWQLEVRKMCDPIDADNAIAKMEETIRRHLRRVSLKVWQLKKKVHVERTGLYIFEMAKNNLQKAGEIGWDKRNKVWFLAKH